MAEAVVVAFEAGVPPVVFQEVDVLQETIVVIHVQGTPDFRIREIIGAMFQEYTIMVDLVSILEDMPEEAE